MIYFVIAISSVCLYYIVRGLRSQHDKQSTVVALYFIVVPLLGMMIGDAYVEIKMASIDPDVLVPDGNNPTALWVGVVLGFAVAFICYPLIRRTQIPPNQAL